MNTPKRIYLAGPMTGLPEYNHPAFHAEAARLRAAGHEVFNPAEIDIGPGATWLDYMRVCIPALVECDCARFLPGWECSDGAKVEFHVATGLKMPLTFHQGASSSAAANESTLKD